MDPLLGAGRFSTWAGSWRGSVTLAVIIKPFDGWTAWMDLCGADQTSGATGFWAPRRFHRLRIRGGLVLACLRAMKMPIGSSKGGLMVGNAG